MKKLVVFLNVLFLTATTAFAKDVEKPSYQKLSAETQKISQLYFAAYMALDWQKMEPLLADNVSFEDPTAEFVFGVVKRQGKESVIKGFNDGYAAIVKMQFHPTRTSFSGQHAIFEGILDWSIKLEDNKVVEIKRMPFTSILKVVNGEVVTHMDYADYAPFFAAYKNALE